MLLEFVNKKILVSLYLFLIAFNTSVASATIVHTMDKPYHEYTWVTAHNSHASINLLGDGLSNQKHSMYHQLKHEQVRGLMIDIGYGRYGTFRNRLRLIHGLDAGIFTKRMQNEVVRFLNEDPSAVLFIDIETASNITKKIIADGMKSLPELTQKMFNPKDPRWKNHAQWPTLQELVDANQRVIMVIDKFKFAGDYGDYTIMHRRAVTAENQYAVTAPSSCDERHGYGEPKINITGVRGKNWSRLFTMNHFGTLGNRVAAGNDNNWDGLYERIKNCKKVTGLSTSGKARNPNFLAVDFVNRGDVQEISEVLTEGGIIFYEGNNATQNIVCGLGARRNQIVLRRQRGCENDEARSARLVNVPAGTAFSVYNNVKGDTHDAYLRVAALSDVGFKSDNGYIIKHFQMNDSNRYINMDYRGAEVDKPNSNKLNGKVSRWEIDKSTEAVDGVVHQAWSRWLKESKGKHFICPKRQILVARVHVGDENGRTRYKCATYEVHGTNVVTGHRTWSHKIKESSHRKHYICPANQVMVGRDHDGDEDGPTHYYCETLKPGFFTDTGPWIGAGKESSSNFICPDGRVMVARAHHGDENGLSYYKCAKISSR